MAVPKRKKSKMRVRQRRATIKVTAAETTTCEACGATRQSHRACPKCGAYNKRGGTEVAAPAAE